MRALAGDRLEGRKVLLTVGRLVERKGVVHFLDYILPRVLAARPRRVLPDRRARGRSAR